MSVSFTHTARRLGIVSAVTTTILMVAVHAWAPPRGKALTCVVFMSLRAVVTCGLHFVVLTLSRQEAVAGQAWLPAR